MFDLETQARAAGYAWDEIDDYLGGATQDALAQGYSQDDVDAYLGFNPTRVARRAETAIHLAPGTPSDPEGALNLDMFDWRGQYANALMFGETRGTYDFADSIAAAAFDRLEVADPDARERAMGWATRAADGIAASLPSRRDFTDAALDVSGAGPDSEGFGDVRNNLIDHWRETGEMPVSAAGRSRVNAELAEKLTKRPERGLLGEIGAGMARAAGSFVFGVERIANQVELTIADTLGSDWLKSTAAEDVRQLARREAEWQAAYKRGEGVAPFVAGVLGEAVPTVAEYIALGIPRMVAYGALNGAAKAWERTGSATASYAGALIGGALAGAPAPFLHGAAGQGLARASVKGAIGMGAVGGLTPFLDPAVPDWVSGKGYELPTAAEVGEAAAAGALVGGAFGAFVGRKPQVRVVDPTPEARDRVVDFDAPELKPTETLHNFAADLAGKADQLERLRQENEGLIPGNATESGGFFSRLALQMSSDIVPSAGVVPTPIKAFHASPHDFTKFDFNAVGVSRGEGVQGEGHGLYFTESPKAHEFYKKQFGEEVRADDFDKSLLTPEGQRTLDETHGGDPLSLLDDLARALDDGEKLSAQEEVDYDYLVNLNWRPVDVQAYTVNLHLDPTLVVDRDASIADQPPKVAAALRALNEEAHGPARDDYMLSQVSNDVLAGDIMDAAAFGTKLTKAEVTDFLVSKGVQGAKYRGDEGRGKYYNYVVFDDGKIEMLEKNGQPIKPAELQQQAVALAEGYRAADTLRSTFDSWFGPVWRDESGGGRVKLSSAEREAMRGQLDVTEQILRRGQAIRDMNSSGIRDALNPIFRAFEPHLGEWREAWKSRDPDRIMETKAGQMIAYLDGEFGAELPGDHPLRAPAMMIREAYIRDRAWQEDMIARGLLSEREFIENYWPYLWKDRANAERIFGSPNMARKTPTYRDGIRAGLEPAIEHPIDHVLHDLTRRAHMRARTEMIARLADEGTIIWSKDSPSQVKDGSLHEIYGLTKKGTWTEQELSYPVSPAVAAAEADVASAVMGGSRPGPAGGQHIVNEQKVEGTLYAYARYKPVAKMVRDWNGALRDYPFDGDWMTKFNYASNTLLALKLWWPGFHAITILKEVLGGGFGKAMREIGDGNMLTALADIGKTVTIVPRLREQWKLGIEQGEKLRELALKGPDAWEPDALTDALLTGGYRQGRRQGIYLPGQATHIIDSVLRGTLGRELRDSMNKLGGGEFGAAAYEAGRLATAISAPLFDIAIPTLKAGATVELAQRYLEKNKTASREEVYRNMRQIVDNIDDRMGEANMDNLFWPRWQKIVGTQAMISLGWLYGTLRVSLASIGVRMAGSRSGLEWNPYALSSLAGLLVVAAGTNALYQYLMTGKLPGEGASSIAYDLVAPRTGGTTKGWAPARAMIAGPEKEYYDWGKIASETYAGAYFGGANGGFSAFGEAMQHYGQAKLRPLWGIPLAFLTGEDAIGHDIAHMPGGWPKFLALQVAPIMLNNWHDYRPAGGVPLWQQMGMGNRELTDWLADPRRFWSIQQYLATRKTREELRRWRRERAYRAVPAPGG